MCEADVRTENTTTTATASTTTNSSSNPTTTTPTGGSKPIIPSSSSTNTSVVTVPSPSYSSASSSLSRSDLASKRIGEKLLSGWALLGDTCSICNTPYMRPRNERTLKICVLCSDNSGNTSLNNANSSNSIRPPFVHNSQVPPPNTVSTTIASSSSSSSSPGSATRSLGYLSHLRSNSSHDSDDEESSASPPKDIPSSPSSITAAPKTTTTVAYKSGMQQMKESEEWEAALREIEAGIEADAKGGPKARSLVSQRQSNNTQFGAKGNDGSTNYDDDENNSSTGPIDSLGSIVNVFDHDAAIKFMNNRLGSALTKNNSGGYKNVSSSSSSQNTYQLSASGSDDYENQSNVHKVSSLASSTTNNTNNRVFGSTIINAPANWRTMKPDEISAYFQEKTGNVINTANLVVEPTTSTASVPVVKVVEPPPPSSSLPSTSSSGTLVPGQRIKLPVYDGNVGPSGQVQFLGPLSLRIDEPTEDMVNRIARGLAKADEEAQKEKTVGNIPEKSTVTKESVTAVASIASSGKSTATTRGNSSAVRVSTTVSTTNAVSVKTLSIPANTSTALEALYQQLATENSTILRLSSLLNGSGNDMNTHIAEALAETSSRISKLVQGIRALESVLTTSNYQ